MPFETTAAGEQAWNRAALTQAHCEDQAQVRDQAPGQEQDQAQAHVNAWGASKARIWTWPRPAIVLGRSQQRELEAVRTRMSNPDIEVVVRTSGGGAVLAGPWLIGASVILPAGHPLLGRDLVDSYRWLGEVHREVLAGIGVSTQLLSPGDIPRLEKALPGGPVGWACFGGLSPWEIVDWSGRKLVGLAQQRRRDAVLLVSGLLLATPPWTLLCRALRAEGDEERLAGRTTSVQALLERGSDGERVGQVATELERSIQRYLKTSSTDTR